MARGDDRDAAGSVSSRSRRNSNGGAHSFLESAGRVARGARGTWDDDVIRARQNGNTCVDCCRKAAKSDRSGRYKDGAGDRTRTCTGSLPLGLINRLPFGGLSTERVYQFRHARMSNIWDALKAFQDRRSARWGNMHLTTRPRDPYQSCNPAPKTCASRELPDRFDQSPSRSPSASPIHRR